MVEDLCLKEQIKNIWDITFTTSLTDKAYAINPKKRQ